MKGVLRLTNLKVKVTFGWNVNTMWCSFWGDFRQLVQRKEYRTMAGHLIPFLRSVMKERE